MTPTSLDCPSCRQRIHNPSTERAIRCGNCGFVFNFGGAERKAPDEVLLGREPAPASYGLLILVSRLLIPAVLIDLAARIVTDGSYQVAWKTPSRRLSQILTWMSIEQLLNAFMIFLATIAFSMLASLVVRTDRKAAWIGWRCGATPVPLRPPGGSDLPVLLPLSAIGGLKLLLGLVTFGTSGQSINVVENIADGVVLILLALAACEFRRFMWRMSELGHAIPERKKGEDLPLGHCPSAARRYTRVKPRRQALYILTLRGMETVVFLAFMSAWWTTSFSAYRLQWRNSYIMEALTVGAAIFTILQLDQSWARMMTGFSHASSSIEGGGARKVFGQRSSSVFQGLGIAGAALLSLKLAFSGISYYEDYRSIDSNYRMTNIIYQSIIVLWLFWLVDFKRNSTQFVRYSWFMCDDNVKIKHRLGLKIMAWFVPIFGILGQLFVLVAGLAISYPFHADEQLMMALLPWFVVLLVLDFDRAAQYLESCVTYQEIRENSAAQ